MNRRDIQNISSGECETSRSVRPGSLETNHVHKELLDCQKRIGSLRFELERAENEIHRVQYLRRVVLLEENSVAKAIKVGRLVLACVVPDIVKWVLRPLTRKAKRLSRRFEARSPVEPYLAKVAHPSQSRKRVLHALANFMTGGSSRLVVDLIEGLSDFYEQQVLTGFIPAPVAYKGVVVHEYRGYYEILGLLEQYRPEVLHVHYWGDVDFSWYDKVFRAAERFGCRIIENVNTPIVPYRSGLVRAYVYVSDYVLREYGWPDGDNRVIHPGSDLAMFSREETAAPAEDCIGMVYRLEPDKLDRRSIDVFIDVVKRRPKTKVLIVGHGSLLDVYRDAVLANAVMDAFHFTGAVPYADLPALYAQMSIFVAPVWKESFGQVSCFAMSMGIPVVGYRVGGLEEIIDDDGLLAKPGDSGQLADTIVNLLDDRAKRLAIGERNKRRVHSAFSVEQMAQQYGRLYHDVVGAQK